MKGITSNPALDAYQRMAVGQVSATHSVDKPATEHDRGQASSSDVAKVSISAEARDLATSAAKGKLDPEKVERIQAELKEGSLQLDSTIIARRIITALG